jgi:hypothetical protein
MDLTLTLKVEIIPELQSVEGLKKLAAEKSEKKL